jgi:hypothetical protein
MSGQTQQAIAKRVEVTAAVAELIIDTGVYPSTKLEGVVNSSVATTYNVSGSIDAITWRKTTEIVILIPEIGIDKPFFYDNAYRYVKIETTDVGDHLIEVAGGQG